MARLTGAVAHALLAFALWSCGSAQHPAHREALEPIVLSTLGGEGIDLSELRGQPIVLFFFTTYSGPAQAIAPFVAQVARRHVPDGLSVIGIALEPAEGPVVQAWADFMQPPYPIAIATPELVDGHSPLGPIPAIPSFAFIDRDGALAGWDIRLLRESELDAIVTSLLRAR